MTPTSRYRQPSDLPTRIPVFPLRGAILLPRATLPLNVFEPRYLAMIDAVMGSNRVVGIIQPTTGPAAHGNTPQEESPTGKDVPLHDIGCAGRVTSYQELEDGRYLITISGVARFEILAEVESDAPFRMAAVSYDRFPGDFEEGTGEHLVDRDYLLKVLRTYLEANSMDADWNAIQRASSEVLINALSVMSPYGAEEKQALLEAEDLKTRADVLIALAKMDLASGGSSGGTSGGTVQ